MFKKIKYGIIILFSAFFLWALLTYQSLRYSSPSLISLANKIPPFSSAFVFNYSKEIDKQMYMFSKNIGLEKNPLTKQTEPPLTNIGADGFIIFDINPMVSKNLFKKIDVLLNDTLDFINQTTLNSHSNKIHLVVDETEDENYITESPFNTPLSSFLEEIWNGKTFLIGGATQFNLSLMDTFQLALAPRLKKTMNLNSNFFRDMLIKNIPLYFQDFLNNHSIHIDIEPPITNIDTKIHTSQIIMTIDNFQDFLDSICSVKINPWDLCGRFSIHRKKFRSKVESLFGLVSNNFKITIQIYWTLQGKDLIFSNQKEFISTILKENNTKNNSNILSEVSSSGDDFLYQRKKIENDTAVSFYFDMIKTQNEWVNLLENSKQHSKILSDYFLSPEGNYSFSKLEKSIYNITRFSQKTSISFRTDGDYLFPELRLYSPSMDLFTQDGKKLSPEFVNSLRVFVTKFISFGHYLLPRGLIQIPGPFMTKNGRWVILNSTISVKSMSPYLEPIDPYIDENETPSPL
jgi:hypothetical protein